jgi:hypothetical protein
MIKWKWGTRKRSLLILSNNSELSAEPTNPLKKKTYFLHLIATYFY